MKCTKKAWLSHAKRNGVLLIVLWMVNIHFLQAQPSLSIKAIIDNARQAVTTVVGDATNQANYAVNEGGKPAYCIDQYGRSGIREKS